MSSWTAHGIHAASCAAAALEVPQLPFIKKAAAAFRTQSQPQPAQKAHALPNMFSMCHSLQCMCHVSCVAVQAGPVQPDQRTANVLRGGVRQGQGRSSRAEAARSSRRGAAEAVTADSECGVEALCAQGSYVHVHVQVLLCCLCVRLQQQCVGVGETYPLV
jgi:hypothetical protein